MSVRLAGRRALGLLFSATFRTTNTSSFLSKVNIPKTPLTHNASKRYYCDQTSLMALRMYTDLVEQTLEDIADHFDELADQGYFNEDYDSQLADGVLTIHLIEHGTYVLNKQTPNRQLWLSSPESGPRRYDFMAGAWVYSHDPDKTLHEFLSQELTQVCQRNIDLTGLSHATRQKQ